jgi:hypothetical protein
MRRIASCPAIIHASLFLIAGQAPAGYAAESLNFVIAASDGYGLEDCLGGADCGQVVADAWCEAHGHGSALAFGKTDDVTGAITSHASAKMPAGAYFITCGE